MSNTASNCPFCAQAGLPPDTTRNLHVRTDGLYHCFRCGAKPSKNGPLPPGLGVAGDVIPKSIMPEDVPIRRHDITGCFACASYLQGRGLNPCKLPPGVGGGWVRGHRILFEQGGWWQGRATSPRNPIRYLFPRDTGQPKPLFHMDPTRGRTKTLCVVEGPFDALRLYQEGFRAVALCGKSFSIDKLIQLQELAPTRIVWGWDRDVTHVDILPWFFAAEPFARSIMWNIQEGADPAEASTRDIHELRKIVRRKW